MMPGWPHDVLPAGLPAAVICWKADGRDYEGP
jgi:hypothetical protein